jgi:carbon starvation protein CstA
MRFLDGQIPGFGPDSAAMTWILLTLTFLATAYFLYGKLLERAFLPDGERTTPAVSCGDNVDYVVMPTWRVFLVQLLNIAGIGPIFGPILGALYGPQALLWVLVGAIFMGGVHDYLSGMFSVRSRGQSIAGVVHEAMGTGAGVLLRVFSIILLLLVGVIFVLSPANLLSALTDMPVPLFVFAIFAYYFIATLVPIHLLIGRLYPILGLILLVGTVGVFVALAFSEYTVLPDMDMTRNRHPEGMPLWPMLFIVLSCGAISGFHSTQSPLMARCLGNEKNGRFVFYGAMLAEACIAMVWVSVGLSFYPHSEALFAVIEAGSPSAVVNEVSRQLLGPVGGIFVVISVIVLPITSGDTAFRSTRLIIAEAFNWNQKAALDRLKIAIPLFAAGIAISYTDFMIVWRYFGWANQSLAALGLWAGAVLLCKNGRGAYHWMASIPAAFMTSVTVTYFFYSPITLGLPHGLSSWGGAGVGLVCLLVCARYASRLRKVGPLA